MSKLKQEEGSAFFVMNEKWLARLEMIWIVIYLSMLNIMLYNKYAMQLNSYGMSAA